MFFVLSLSLFVEQITVFKDCYFILVVHYCLFFEGARGLVLARAKDP